ncbi:MAG: gliding motility protein [Myxococcaceae bacterium]|nr:gliding motility protein [Myxococcaceae bacterium]
MSSSRHSRWITASVCVAWLSGCTTSCQSSDGTIRSGGAAPSGKKGEVVGGLGKQVAPGDGIDLRATPDGRFVTYLLDAQKPRLDGIPPVMRLGTLYAVSTAGGEARKLGSGITNMPGGYLFTGDSRWVLFLVGYNVSAQSGELRAVDLNDAKAEPVKLGSVVTYVVGSKDGRQVAFVDDGTLKVGVLPAGPFRDLAADVTVAEFAPDGKQVYFKRKLTSAGGLYQVGVEGGSAPKKLGDRVGDFKVSPDSRYVAFATASVQSPGFYDLQLADTATTKSKTVAVATNYFAFSPDSRWLARVEGYKGTSNLGALMVGAADGSPGKKIGERVDVVNFAPASNGIAFLKNYSMSDTQGGTLGQGTLMVASLPLEGPAKSLGERVPGYVWSNDGKTLAFVERFFKPLYSVDLMVHSLGSAEQPYRVQQGVYGYLFSADDQYLMFRTGCIRNGRACDLHTVEVAKLKEPPRKAVEGIFSFKPAAEGPRVLVTYARTQGDVYDVAVYNLKSQERKTLDQLVKVPALFVAPDGSKAAYIMSEQGKQGVYVASDGIP